MNKMPVNIFITKNESETENAGYAFAASIEEVGKDVSKPVFVAFYGELGSGKTAFVRGMARYIVPEAYVCSPTYSIINVYEGEKNLVHLDLYRITDEDDLYSIGFYELFDDQNSIIVAEWCENIPYALPENRFDVIFTQENDGTRRIEIRHIK